MKKKNIFIAVLFIIAIASLVLIFFQPENEAEKEVEKPIVVKKDLPNILVTTSDGKRFSTINLKGKTILVFFQPECDHCQREAKQMANVVDRFKDYTLYFISSDKFEAMEKFARNYNLAGHPNIIFAQTTGDQVLNNLGPIDTPSLYIYSEDGKLIKALNGETPIETILQYI